MSVGPHFLLCFDKCCPFGEECLILEFVRQNYHLQYELRSLDSNDDWMIEFMDANAIIQGVKYVLSTTHHALYAFYVYVKSISFQDLQISISISCHI